MPADVVLHPEAFGSASSFRGAVDDVIERVTASPPAEGFQEVLFPGELEQRRSAASSSDSVIVPASVAADLEALFDRLGGGGN